MESSSDAAGYIKSVNCSASRPNRLIRLIFILAGLEMSTLQLWD